MLIYVYAKSYWYLIGKDNFTKYLAKKWQTSEIKCALLNNKYVFNPLDISYNDLKQFEINGPGYVEGGQDLKGKKIATALVMNDNKMHNFFHANNVIWNKSTLNSRWAVLYEENKKNSLLICIDFLFDAVVKKGTMTIQWADRGIIDITELCNNKLILTPIKNK